MLEMCAVFLEIDAEPWCCACRINGLTHLNLTKLDVLSDLETIQLGVQYRLKGEKIRSVPALIEDLEAVSVDYEFMPGWMSDISKVQSFPATDRCRFRMRDCEGKIMAAIHQIPQCQQCLGACHAGSVGRALSAVCQGASCHQQLPAWACQLLMSNTASSACSW